MKVKRDCKVYYNGQMLHLQKDQDVEGGLAQYLADTGAPVDAPEQEKQQDQSPETVDDLMKLKKDELLQIAQGLELDVSEDNTKEEIAKAIVEAESKE